MSKENLKTLFTGISNLFRKTFKNEDLSDESIEKMIKK